MLLIHDYCTFPEALTHIEFLPAPCGQAHITVVLTAHLDGLESTGTEEGICSGLLWSQKDLRSL